METFLYGLHAYLTVVSLWYVALLLLYKGNHPIPRYTKALFDKGSGEHLCFCAGFIFLLVAIGFFAEEAYLIWYDSLSLFFSIVFLGMGAVFIFLSFFSFVFWRFIVSAEPL